MVGKIARIAYGIAASISRSSLYFTIRARSPISTGLRHGLSATIASENGPLGFSQSGFLAAARRCPTGWWRRRYPVHPYPPHPAQSTDDGHDDDPPLIAIFERKEPEWLATRPDDTCPSAQLQAASLRKPDRGRAGQCNGALGDEIGWHMRDFALLYGSKGYLFSSSDPIDTVISSSNSIRLPIPGVLVHDIRICHRGRDHRLLQ